MTRIGLLHHDMEWADEQLAAALQAAGFKVRLHDVRQADRVTLAAFPVVLNRVYASVSGRDVASVRRALELVEGLEAMGVYCINGSRATRADYDKHFAWRCMAAAGIPTPATGRIQAASSKAVLAAVRAWGNDKGYPVILKPNTGGRGRDVVRIGDAGDAAGVVEAVLESARSVGYTGEWVVQAFVRAARPFDCRISVIDGNLTHSHTRTLVARGSEAPWIASNALGSTLEPYEPSPREIEVAREATRSIGADWNEVDLCFGPHGPVVIENNPTPRYSEGTSGYAVPLLIDHVTAIIRAAAAGHRPVPGPHCERLS